MKTYNQFNEDLEQRRQELAQGQKERASNFVKRNKERAQAQKAQIDADRERENLKKEIKREIQSEM